MNEQLKALQAEVEAVHLELLTIDRDCDKRRKVAMQRLNIANAQFSALVSMLPERKGEA